MYNQVAASYAADLYNKYSFPPAPYKDSLFASLANPWYSAHPLRPHSVDALRREAVDREAVYNANMESMRQTRERRDSRGA